MDGKGEGSAEGGMKMSKPSFSQSSEIFSCVCSSEGRWLETKTTGLVKSEWLNQPWRATCWCAKFSALTAQKAVVCRYLSTYCRGSKRISCPCLCPSSCSWGRCQLAPLKEGKGLHLVYIPASKPWMQKWKVNYSAFCWLMLLYYSIITNKKRWNKMLVLNINVHVKKCKKYFLFTVSILNLTRNMYPMLITKHLMNITS